MSKSTKLSSWRILSLAVLLSATCANGYPKSEAWRLDIRYEPWPLKGDFMNGTPDRCPAPEQPNFGRWVCSYSNGGAGRSLCMIDCMKGYIIKDEPLIFNCEGHIWKSFPIPNDVDILPGGTCVPVTRKYKFEKRFFKRMALSSRK